MDFNTFIVSNTGRDLEYHRRARTVGIEFAENAYKAGVLAEREACAKICHEIQMSKYSHDSGDEYYQGYGEGAKDCWQAIRARK